MRAARSRDRSRDRGRLDGGFTMVEVIVALAIFATFATASLTVLNAALRTTSDDSARLTAVNLATRELEITRDAFTSPVRGPDRVRTNRVVNPSPLPGGRVGDPLEVDGIPYTVVRTAQWRAVGSVGSTCDDGTTQELAYLVVTVEVSWPALNGRRPVSMQTTMTPPKGTYSDLDGHIGVKVVDGLGKPVSGVLATARRDDGTTRSGTTGSDGCALLSFLPAGTYAITLSAAGYVDPDGDPQGTTSATVQAGQLWRGSVEYDRGANVTATFVTKVGFGLPQVDDLDVTLGNSALTPSGSRTVEGDGATRVVGPLWPYPSGYQLWAGGCIDNDPQHVDPDEGRLEPGVRDEPVETPAGGSSTGRVWLAPVRVDAPPGADLVARQPLGTGCGGQTVRLGVVPADGVLRTSLPFGRWRIARAGQTGGPEAKVLPPRDAAPSDADAATVVSLS